MANERDNVRVGVFVLAGLSLTFVAVLLLSDWRRWIEPRREVVVRFALDDGLHGLREGADVTLGYQTVGVVTRIGDERRQDGAGHERVVAKRVHIRVPRRVELYENAVIELAVPPLGSGASLNIRHVGTGQPLADGASIDGRIAGFMITQSMASDMGVAEEQRRQIARIIDDAHALSGVLRTSGPELVEKLSRAADRLDPLLTEASEVVADLKAIAADARVVTRAVRERHEGWLDGVDQAIQTTGRTLRQIEASLERIAPRLSTAAEHLEHAAQRLDQEQMAQLEQALASGHAALGRLERTAGELDALVVSQKPVVERTLANMQLTSAQLKLAAIEVRRAPWRLLYTPDDEELAHDNLYDAARSFSLAASSLDAAAASLQAVVDRRPDADDDLQRMVESLKTLFAAFEATEKRFFDALDQPAE